MLPIADAGATTHIIATRDDDQALTTDIDVVLYEKTATGWDGTAYDPSVSKEDAMVDLATEFGLADPFGGTWQIDLDPTNATGAVAIPRQPFGKGFFMYDPLYFIANQLPNPNPLAQSAEAAGLPAGSGAINTGGNIGGPSPTGGCSCDACIQTSIAAGIDAYLADSSLSIDDVELVAKAELESLFGCCGRWTWTTGSSGWGPWYCSSGWALDPAYPSPIQNGPCSVNCHYERDVSRDRTRTRVRRIWDCSRCTWTETCTETGQQKGRATVGLVDSGCHIPAGFTCPAGPDNPGLCTDGPGTGVSHGPWTGTPPC